MSQKKQSDQNEKPTERRLTDSRKKGNVAKSQDLSKALTFTMWVAVLFSYFNEGLDRIGALMMIIFTPSRTTNYFTNTDTLWLAAEAFFYVTIPPLITLSLIGTVIEFFQAGSVFSTSPIKPDIKHLDPVNGLKRIFSNRNFVEFLKSIVKCIVLFTIIGLVASQHLNEYLSAYRSLSAIQVLDTHSNTLLIILACIIFAFLAIGLLDFLYQRIHYVRNLMMSKRDIQQERKETDGDPVIKNQRKQLHQQWSQQNMLMAASKANVILVNPTEIAVALHYEQQGQTLPCVVAKGRGELAASIRKIAIENDIPIIKNISLARALESEIEIDHCITSQYFQAVAEVLKWANENREKVV